MTTPESSYIRFCTSVLELTATSTEDRVLRGNVNINIVISQDLLFFQVNSCFCFNKSPGKWWCDVARWWWTVLMNTRPSQHPKVCVFIIKELHSCHDMCLGNYFDASALLMLRHRPCWCLKSVSIGGKDVRLRLRWWSRPRDLSFPLVDGVPGFIFKINCSRPWSSLDRRSTHIVII